VSNSRPTSTEGDAPPGQRLVQKCNQAWNDSWTNLMEGLNYVLASEEWVIAFDIPKLQSRTVSWFDLLYVLDRYASPRVIDMICVIFAAKYHLLRLSNFIWHHMHYQLTRSICRLWCFHPLVPVKHSTHSGLVNSPFPNNSSCTRHRLNLLEFFRKHWMEKLVPIKIASYRQVPATSKICLNFLFYLFAEAVT